MNDRKEACELEPNATDFLLRCRQRRCHQTKNVPYPIRSFVAARPMAVHVLRNIPHGVGDDFHVLVRHASSEICCDVLNFGVV